MWCSLRVAGFGGGCQSREAAGPFFLLHGWLRVSHYSSVKALLHADRLSELRAGKQIVPVHAQLVISDLCSQGCDFCSYRWDGNTSNQLFHIIDPRTGQKNHNPNRKIPTEKCFEIIDDLAEMRVQAIQFTGGGEPTVHPQHARIFRHALDRGLECALVSHGVLLQQSTIEMLAEFAWVRISVDAGKPETYSAVRKVSTRQYYHALENIESICNARDNHDSPLVVGFGFVVTRDNWREVVDAATTAKGLGVDSFRISAVFQPDNAEYFREFYEEAAELCREAERLSGGRFQVVNSFGNRIGDLEQGRPISPRCGYMQFTTYIGGDLNVYRCCNQSYNENGLIGSIANQRFRDLWESEAKQEDFERFNPGGCERCQFNRQNEAIEAARTAKHEGFV